MDMDHENLLALLAMDSKPDPGILLDDGKYYIEEESADSGLLLRICNVALLEQDDAECHGGYQRREDGAWVINFCVTAKDDLVENMSAEFDDRDSAIVALWKIRSMTAGYRTGDR